jgi:hypothetical protein
MAGDGSGYAESRNYFPPFSGCLTQMSTRLSSEIDRPLPNLLPPSWGARTLPDLSLMQLDQLSGNSICSAARIMDIVSACPWGVT